MPLTKQFPIGERKWQQQQWGRKDYSCFFDLFCPSKLWVLALVPLAIEKLAAKSNMKVTERAHAQPKSKNYWREYQKSSGCGPIESEKVLKAAQEHGVIIELILTTHHH